MNKIELLAPAGDWDSLVGAINAGANAIYLSGKKFGARSFASNFELNQIFSAIEYAHLRNVLVYVTINTLIYDHEISTLLTYTDELVRHHVDALIIQDLGLLELFSLRYPDTDLHASTQMNVLNIDQAKFLKSKGVKRIILARESSIEMIKKIKSAVDIELEVFVHGALCISYSGNCLFSSMIGGRSGNRGECAQSCRLPYQLLRDNAVIEPNSYLLSAKDLITIEHIYELLNSGVTSFKIEGRMRKPEYVIQTVLSYKNAINQIFLGSSIDYDQEIDNLVRVFNRGQTRGYLFSETPKNIVNSERPNHIGVPIGKVDDCYRGKVTVTLTDTLHLNDGIRFLGQKDIGMGVSRILSNGINITTAFAGETIILDSPEYVEPGSQVLKTLDIELETSLQKYIDEGVKHLFISGEITANLGDHLKINASDEYGHNWEVVSDFIIPKADSHPITKDNLIEHFSKLGNTPYEWISLEIYSDQLGFIPVKIINELRRTLIENINHTILYRPNRTIHNEINFTPSVFDLSTPSLVVSVSNQEQLSAAISSGITEIYISENIQIERSLYPQITFRHRKKRIWSDIDTLPNDTSVISEVGHLLKQDDSSIIVTDEFLNVTNIHALHFLHHNGAYRVTLSPETNKEVAETIVKNYIAFYHEYPNIEKVVYGREELMISKYCPIAKTYDTNINCNLCYKNQYSLRDRKGAEYPLINDGSCNIKIMHSKPLVLIDYLHLFVQNGINTLRLNFTVENKQTTLDVIAAYKNAMEHLPYSLSRENVTTGRFNTNIAGSL